MKKLHVLFLFILLTLSAGSLVAAQTEDFAQVRFAHFVPDGGNIDLYIDGESAALEDVIFGTVSDWYQLPAGSYTFALVPTLQSPDNAIVEATVAVEAGGWYTVAAIGIAELDTVTLDVIEEDYSPLGFGETRISAYHAIPEFNAVDVLLDDEIFFGYLAYPDSETLEDGTLTDGFETATLPETTGVISVVDKLNPEEALLEVDEFTFSADRNYFIGFIGVRTSPTWVLVSTNVSTIEDEFAGDLREVEATTGDGGFLRVAHLSTSAPEVDVYINGELSEFVGVEFTDVTGFVQLPNGTYSVSIAPEGEGAASAVLETEVTFNGGEHVTVVAYGFVEDNSLSLVVVENDFSPLDTGLFRVEMFHADTGLQPVDLVRDDGLDAIRYLGHPGYDATSDGFASVDLLAGEYAFSIVSSVDPTRIVAEIPTTLFSPNRVYFIGVIASDTGYTFAFEDVTGN